MDVSDGVRLLFLPGHFELDANVNAKSFDPLLCRLTLALSALSSAILADFDMRGCAISVLTLAVRALYDSLFCRFMDFIRSSRGLQTRLIIQTIKQIINKVPSSPYPNIVSPS